MQSEILDSIKAKKHITIDDFPNPEIVLLTGIKLNDVQWLIENPPKPPRINENPEPVPEKRKRQAPQSVINEYQLAVGRVRRMLELKLADYEKDPDSHPQYKEEWEKFWKDKVDELSRRGEDPNRHDFRDEWCAYFLKRMRQLHDREVNKRIEKIRQELGVKQIDLRGKRTRHNSEDLSDKDDTVMRRDAPRIPKDVLYVKEKKIYDEFLEKDNDKEEPTSLIGTCRILSALETELGLLAPKVLDLLSRAIAFERTNNKSADELLFDNDNLILLETVKEKIVGMQMAHLVVISKSKAAARAVEELKKLIEQHEVLAKIKKTLKDMGKDEASQEEIDMLKAMYDIKKIRAETKGPRKRSDRRRK